MITFEMTNYFDSQLAKLHFWPKIGQWDPIGTQYDPICINFDPNWVKLEPNGPKIYSQTPDQPPEWMLRYESMFGN